MSKRKSFDPVALRNTFDNRKKQRLIYSDSYKKFSDCIAGIDIAKIEDEFTSSRSVEVVLVHMLGLKGVECLKSAIQLIPKEVPLKERSCYVKCIAEFVLGENILTDDAIDFVIRLFDNYLKFDMDDTLCALSKTTGTAYTDFLAPPTSSCLNERCKNFGNPHSLYQHHSPVTVSVFTLDRGPKPATKFSLKCRECSTIYNYNSFGKKKTEGERFYDTVRDYVEVSDVTYCCRGLLKMYSLLRYAWCKLQLKHAS